MIDRKNKQYKTDKLFLEVAEKLSKQSHCESLKVCALAVNNNRIIGTGINGTPPKLTNCDSYFKKYYIDNNIKIEYDEWIKTKEWRELHHKWSLLNEIHAEISLIGICAKTGVSIDNATIYCTHQPCSDCTKALISCGVKKIVFLNKYDKTPQESIDLINQAKIIYKQIK